MYPGLPSAPPPNMGMGDPSGGGGGGMESYYTGGPPQMDAYGGGYAPPYQQQQRQQQPPLSTPTPSAPYPFFDKRMSASYGFPPPSAATLLTTLTTVLQVMERGGCRRAVLRVGHRSGVGLPHSCFHGVGNFGNPLKLLRPHIDVNLETRRHVQSLAPVVSTLVKIHHFCS